MLRLACVALFVGVLAGVINCNSDPSPTGGGSPDMTRGPSSMGDMKASGTASDMSTASCGPALATWCTTGKNQCVNDWATAMKPESWCEAGRVYDIFVTQVPCGSGNNVVVLVDFNTDFGSYNYMYSGDSGQLRAVQYLAGENADPECLSGDPATLTTLPSGCQFMNPLHCDNGTLTPVY